MQLGRKIGFSLLLKNESNQLSKTTCTSRKTKLHHKRPKFTCKCEACSKCISQTITEVLVHKRWLQKPLQHHAKFRKRPKTYQSQMLFHHSAANPELCTKKTLLSPNSSCHTKSCRNVAHVHRINGSLYFHTPFCYDFHAVQPRKFTTCNTMQKYVSISSENHCEDPHTKSFLPSSCRCLKIPVYVNYSCVIAVVCVRILIDAEKLNSKCQVEITLQRIPCSPVHHKRSSIDSAQSIHTSEFQAHCTKRKP